MYNVWLDEVKFLFAIFVELGDFSENIKTQNNENVKESNRGIGKKRYAEKRLKYPLHQIEKRLNN